MEIFKDVSKSQEDGESLGKKAKRSQYHGMYKQRSLNIEVVATHCFISGFDLDSLDLSKGNIWPPSQYDQKSQLSQGHFQVSSNPYIQATEFDDHCCSYPEVWVRSKRFQKPILR